MKQENDAKLIRAALQQQLKNSISLKKQCSFVRFEVKRICNAVTHGENIRRADENRTFFWINGQYAYGLLCTGEREGIDCLIKFYNQVKLYNLLGLIKFNLPDTVLHAYVMMRMIVEHHTTQYVPLVHKAAEYIKKEASANNNLIRYRPPSRQFLIDSIGMVTGFCYLYGNTYDDRALIEIADNQITYALKMTEKYRSVFPYHAYDIDTNAHSGNNMWGRGIGWFLLGLTEAAINHPDQFQNAYQTYLNRVFEYQNQDGFFYDEFAAKNQVDSSITSMAALSLAQGLNYGLIQDDAGAYANKLNRCVTALGTCCTENGEVINCTGECCGSGNYSEQYGNFFAQGYTLALFCTLPDNHNDI